MKTILSVIHGPVFGGGFNQILALDQALRSRGYAVTAGVSGEPGDAWARLDAAGVELERLDLHRLRATADPRPNLALATRFWPEVRALRRLIREREFDLVQAHGDTNPHVAVAGHLEGVAVVWEIYDTRTPVALRRLTMPLVTRVADVVTTWGDELARVHPGAGGLGERQVTVFPPVDSGRFRPDPELRASARRELGVGDDELLVGSVGVLNPSKGHQWLARAVPAIRAGRGGVRFRVLGASSPAHASYEASVRREVENLGLDRDDFAFLDPGGRVNELLPGFDVFVLSSVPRSEGMPTAIGEAMACGLPIVSTDVGAVRELVSDGITGYLVRPEDPAAIAAAVTRLCIDEDLRRSMGAAALALVAERFGLEACADRRVSAYEIALEHRRLRRSGRRVGRRSP